MKSVFAFVVVAGIGAFANMQAAHAEVLNFGKPFNITGTDFAAGDFNETISLSKSAQTFDSGGLTISEKTTSLSGGSEFAEFYITTTSGGPLISNGSTNGGNFSIYLNNIPLTQKAISGNYYFDFVTNGAVNTGITGSGGIQVEANPNPGSLGAGQNAFYFPYTTASTATTTGFGQFEHPFSYYASVFNTDPNATGYVLGIQLTGVSAVPLPPALPMFGAALITLAAAGYGFKKKAGAAVA